MRAPKSTAHTWLQLLRAPNLFTVPGDPIAGILLAGGAEPGLHHAAAILGSLCFYSYGLLLNDLADLKEDRQERPRRPLPSGAVSPGRVALATAVLGAAGLLCSLAAGPTAFLVGVALVVLVTLYNLRLKKIAIAGPINMGLCRGLSVLLGAAAVAPSTLPGLALLAAAGATLYIAVVTNLARLETHCDPPPRPRALPFPSLIIVIVPMFLLALDRSDPLGLLNLALYAVAAYTLYAGFQIHRHLTREPAPKIPPVIGQLIRLLLPLQALWCLASGSAPGVIAAAILLALWPISRHVSRRFYAS